MTKHLLTCLTLAASLFCAPLLDAHQARTASTTPLFWLDAADDCPDAFFTQGETSVADRLARAAMLPARCADVTAPRQFVGPAFAHGIPMRRPDFFAESFLAAQD